MGSAKDLIYIFMIGAIFVSIFYKPEHVHDDGNNTDEQQDSVNGAQENPTPPKDLKEQIRSWLKSLKPHLRAFQNSPNFFFIVIPLLAVLILAFIWRVVSENKRHAQNVAKARATLERKAYVEQVSKNQEYDKITKETTQREIKKLFDNETFKKMIEEKGENPENWNWQSREKAKKTVFRQRDENKSDTSDEHMSQVDFSDEEKERNQQQPN